MVLLSPKGAEVVPVRGREGSALCLYRRNCIAGRGIIALRWRGVRGIGRV